MQSLINLLALTSFVVSASVVGGGIFLYTNKDTLIEKAKGQLLGGLTTGLTDKWVESPSGLIPTPLEIPTDLPPIPYSPF